MQDIEFTIERGKLYMLQTRTGKRTGLAAIHIAFDLHESVVIDRDEVVRRIEPDMLVQLLAPIFDPKDKDKAKKNGKVLAKGLPAGPGAAFGAVAFTARRAVEMAQRGRKVLLVRAETSPEDLAGMGAAVGAMRKYRWPGNIRELENRIKKAVVLAEGPLITAQDLALRPENLEPIMPLVVAKEEFQKRYINRFPNPRRPGRAAPSPHRPRERPPTSTATGGRSDPSY